MAPIKSVELPNQVKLSYVEQGDSAGTPVLLLHGIVGSWRSFELVLPHLPSSLHTFALTQRGHGDSSKPETGYRLTDFSADMAAFMDALHLEAAFIIGHLMGSAVAQRFAMDHPERTFGLVLAGAGMVSLGNPAVQAFYDSTVSKLTDPVDPSFIRKFLQSTLAQPVPHEFFETMMQDGLKVPAHVWKAASKGRLKEDFSGKLSKITAPTLIIWGDQDARCSQAIRRRCCQGLQVRGSWCTLALDTIFTARSLTVSRPSSWPLSKMTLADGWQSLACQMGTPMRWIGNRGTDTIQRVEVHDS